MNVSVMPTVSKWNGAGNDFVAVAGNSDVVDEVAFARSVCDRETGIDHPDARRRGADGVLFLSLAPDRPSQIEMHHVQPDGSTPAMCGNGVRCAAKWAAERLGTDRVAVETGAGPHPARIDGWDVTVEMRPPSFDPAAVPVVSDVPLVEEPVAGLTVTAVTTGVPHAVAFVDDVSDVALSDVAPPVRHADVFPEGTNVTLASHTRAGGISQRTYERGVEGETDACGTGAVAIVAVAVETGRASPGETLHVSPPGGQLAVSVGERQTTLGGPVECVFETDVSVGGDGTHTTVDDPTR